MIIVFKEEAINEIVQIYSKEEKPEIISENNNYFEIGYDYYNREDNKIENASCFYDKDDYYYLDIIDSDFLSSFIKRLDDLYTDKYLFLKSADYLLRSYPDIYEYQTEKFLTDIDIQINIEKIKIDIDYYKKGMQGKWLYYIPSIGQYLDLEKISTIDIDQAVLLLKFELKSLKAKQKLIIKKRKSGEYTWTI